MRPGRLGTGPGEGETIRCGHRYWRKALGIQPDAPDLQIALATATYESAKTRQADGMPALEGAGLLMRSGF